jgi:transcriptional regulator with XRE-family HTH domain
MYTMKKIDDFTDKVISEIERTRQQEGMSTQKLIEKSGIRRSTYFRKMRGDTSFTTSDVDAIAKALNVNAILLMQKAALKHDETVSGKQERPSDEDARLARTLAKIEDPEQRMALAAYRDPDKGKEDPFDNGAD